VPYRQRELFPADVQVAMFHVLSTASILPLCRLLLRVSPHLPAIIHTLAQHLQLMTAVQRHLQLTLPLPLLRPGEEVLGPDLLKLGEGYRVQRST
jgi:hypothetical protein